MARYIEYKDLIEEVDNIGGLSMDSHNIGPNYAYFAIKGQRVDGYDFIDMAIENGASYIIANREYKTDKDIAVLITEDTSKTMGEFASYYYGEPSKNLKLIGVTGTNGKTSTVTLLHNLFLNLGYKAGMISTIVNKINNKEIESTHTTPDSISINKLLADMVEDSCDYVFMEVSSHALVQNRVWGLEFYIGVFSNITHDHLDYHKTFSEYIRAKKLFFDNLSKQAYSLINLDDKNSEIMVQNTCSQKRTYALKSISDYHGNILEESLEGMLIKIDNNEVYTRLIGRFNAYNILSVYSVAMLCGMNEMETLREISNLEAAEGRFEVIRLNSGAIAIVDYAHTPDALLNVLTTIDEVRNKDDEIITLIGCGGDRDKEKRPIMSRVGYDNSDRLILTSDNPRTEEPELIIKDMEKGLTQDEMSRVFSITSRSEAIKLAYNLAKKDDIILIAGKGHEKYQEINGVKYHFDDREEILKH